MNKSLIRLLVPLSAVIASMPAQAAQFQIDYMMLDADLEDVEEFEPTAVQLKFINPIGPNTDFMAVIAFGLDDDEIEETDPFFGTVSLAVDLSTLFGIYGRAHADIGANSQVYGQLGLVQLKYDLDAEIGGLSGSESYDESGLAYGLGVSFGMTERSALAIEYNVYPDVDVEDIADIETTSLSLGLQLTF